MPLRPRRITSPAVAIGRAAKSGNAVDFYFYDNPVDTGQTASFSLYTDNTAEEVPFFGVSFYPTPVPLPAAVWLLGSGLVALAGLRRSGRRQA